jgi:FtsZ-binding cell division protein ZapB
LDAAELARLREENDSLKAERSELYRQLEQLQGRLAVARNERDDFRMRAER